MTLSERYEAVGPATTLVMSSLTNPSSPGGKQHCLQVYLARGGVSPALSYFLSHRAHLLLLLQVTIPDGKASAYWASKGWKYTRWPCFLGLCVLALTLVLLCLRFALQPPVDCPAV